MSAIRGFDQINDSIMASWREIHEGSFFTPIVQKIGALPTTAEVVEVLDKAEEFIIEGGN